MNADEHRSDVFRVFRVVACYLPYAASVPVSARQPRPSYARQSTQRSGIQPPTTGQPLPPVMQNGCENTEASDVPSQKPGTIELPSVTTAVRLGINSVVSVCLSVYPVHALTFESFDLENPVFLCQYLFRILREIRMLSCWITVTN